MKSPVQERVLALVNENSGYQISDVIQTLPDLDRSSISSALSRLTMQGNLIRKTGKHNRFSYFIPTSPPVPCVLPKWRKLEPEIEITALDLPATRMKQVSMAEWERRFAIANELAKKGFQRRAARQLLELLDVTTEQSLREKIIRKKAGPGKWL